MEKLYRCPVCGWFGLNEEPKVPYNTHEICSCCGIQLGYEVYDEKDAEHEREKWLKNGAPWFDEDYDLKPSNWSIETAETQIKELLMKE